MTNMLQPGLFKITAQNVKFKVG